MPFWTLPNVVVSPHTSGGRGVGAVSSGAVRVTEVRRRAGARLWWGAHVALAVAWHRDGQAQKSLCRLPSRSGSTGSFTTRYFEGFQFRTTVIGARVGSSITVFIRNR